MRLPTVLFITILLRGTLFSAQEPTVDPKTFRVLPLRPVAGRGVGPLRDYLRGQTRVALDRRREVFESLKTADAIRARNGIAVFCFDPIGQSERRQLPADIKFGRRGGPPVPLNPTSARKNESPGPGEGEQNIFGQYTYGLDRPDFLTLAAPRPVVILSATRDYVPIAGAWEAFRDAKRISRAV